MIDLHRVSGQRKPLSRRLRTTYTHRDRPLMACDVCVSQRRTEPARCRCLLNGGRIMRTAEATPLSRLRSITTDLWTSWRHRDKGYIPRPYSPSQPHIPPPEKPHTCRQKEGRCRQQEQNVAPRYAVLHDAHDIVIAEKRQVAQRFQDRKSVV